MIPAQVLGEVLAVLAASLFLGLIAFLCLSAIEAIFKGDL